MSKNALILFTHDPVIDSRRKRISGRSGLNQQVFHQFLRQTCQVIREAQQVCDYDVMISSEHPVAQIEEYHLQKKFDGRVVPLVQMGDNFATRFQDALQSTFSLGYEKVIIIGNDSPELCADDIADAFRKLHTGQIVLGPSVDGGVYLMGFTAFDASIFNNVRWHSDRVLPQLIDNAQTDRQKLFLLRTLRDIDKFGDLRSWFNESRSLDTSLHQLLVAILYAPYSKNPTKNNLTYNKMIPRQHGKRSPPVFPLFLL